MLAAAPLAAGMPCHFNGSTTACLSKPRRLRRSLCLPGTRGITCPAMCPPPQAQWPCDSRSGDVCLRFHPRICPPERRSPRRPASERIAVVLCAVAPGVCLLLFCSLFSHRADVLSERASTRPAHRGLPHRLEPREPRPPGGNRCTIANTLMNCSSMDWLRATAASTSRPPSPRVGTSRIRRP